MSQQERLAAAAKVLTSHGYGLSEDDLAAELARLIAPEEVLYTLSRAAEKIGAEAFDDALAALRGW